MAQVQVELSDALKAKAESRAAEMGHTSIEQYLQSLVQADTDGADFGAPEHLSIQSDDQLEQLLTSRAEDKRASVDATPDFWQKLHDRVQQRRGTKGQ